MFKHDEKTYLITNWHILAGRKPKTRAVLHGSGGLPTLIRVHFPLDGQVTQQSIQTYPLQGSDGSALWIEHPSSDAVDVAALEIQPPQGIATVYISEAVRAPGLRPRDTFFSVTQEVWVIGFPLGIRVRGLPIWKRATIASEPGFSGAESPHRVLLDTATRQGMSGSPVLFVTNSVNRLTFDGSTQEVDLPSAHVLLGIYSGRITGEDEFAAQIGIAWGAECIEELLSAGGPYRTAA
ncbi:MAG: trypsin-like peptidase domain-containing protein [Accumulibacter sp.]|uniref:trypsin-like peptidase domain-containing protein n=1 Tax=Accumulibacter sp. TaxID=2053492 RepID=UPI00331612EE